MSTLGWLAVVGGGALLALYAWVVYVLMVARPDRRHRVAGHARKACADTGSEPGGRLSGDAGIGGAWDAGGDGGGFGGGDCGGGGGDG